MTRNTRYEAKFDALSDERRAAAEPGPCNLPSQAYGPQPLEWAEDERPPVWAWVTWPHKPAERIAAFAWGWNDRVVMVEWFGPQGSVTTVVWRNAVTRRSARSGWAR